MEKIKFAGVVFFKALIIYIVCQLTAQVLKFIFGEGITTAQLFAVAMCAKWAEYEYREMIGKNDGHKEKMLSSFGEHLSLALIAWFFIMGVIVYMDNYFSILKYAGLGALQSIIFVLCFPVLLIMGFYFAYWKRRKKPVIN